MSSLSATQADGYYIPPSYLNSGAYKKKSLRQFTGAKGHNQYLTNSIVRFELPYHGVCQNPSCNKNVGKGTRFNAKKVHCGNYFTTKIYEFQMKCRACSKEEFVIRTNPKERSFDYVKGLKKRVQEFDTEEAGTLGVVDTDFGNGIESWSSSAAEPYLHKKDKKNPLCCLESAIMGERKAMTDRDAMEFLLNHNHRTFQDDAKSNSNLRAHYRVERKAKKRRLGQAAAAGLGRGIELADLERSDLSLAQKVFQKELSPSETQHRSRKREMENFRNVRAASLFGKKSETKRQRPICKTSRLNDLRQIMAPSDIDCSIDNSNIMTGNDKLKIFKGKKKVVKIQAAVASVIKNPSSPLSRNLSKPTFNAQNGTGDLCKSSSLSILEEYASDSDES